MSNEIKVKKTNEDGVVIIKIIPLEMYSSYHAVGWEIVKEKEKPSFTKSKFNKEDE